MIKRFFLIVGVASFVFIAGIGIFFFANSFTEDRTSSGLTVTETGSVSKDTTSGISYSDPESLVGSWNKYIRVYHVSAPEKGSLNEFKSRGSYSPSVNLIFLSYDYKVLNTLFNKKAIINSFSTPTDTSQKNIIYRIAFTDSNKDGILNSNDQDDLYISKLDGSALTKVTNNMEVLNYQFINFNQLFISFFERDLSVKKEDKRKKFALYTIKENRLKLLTEVDQALLRVEEILKK